MLHVVGGLPPRQLLADDHPLIERKPVENDQGDLARLALAQLSRKRTWDVVEHDRRYGGQARETSVTGGEPLVEGSVDASFEVFQPAVVLR